MKTWLKKLLVIIFMVSKQKIIILQKVEVECYRGNSPAMPLTAVKEITDN